LNVKKKSINIEIVPIGGRQHMWLCHKRYSKKSGGEAQSTSYDKGHWNIVDRAYLKKHR